MSKLKISDLTVVTSNPNKLAEINEILGTNHKVSKIDVPEVQSLNLDEVVTAKAISAFQKIKNPVLVEDISMEIKALKGLPGPFVKFFLQTLGTEGTVKILGKAKTDAVVTAALGVYDGKSLKIFKGKVVGHLIKKDTGIGGFGFDKVFVPKGYSQTYAQMSKELKNKVSHRAKALKELKKYLEG